MPTDIEVGFQEFDTTETFLTQAAATNLGGFTLNQDFAPEVEDILRDETVLWQMLLNKKAAPGSDCEEDP